MDTIAKKLPSRLRALRNAQRLSQEALAERSGRSIETISHIERGLSSPTLETLDDIASALGIKVVDLLSSGSSQQDDILYTRLIAAARSLTTKKLEIAVKQIEALAETR